MSLSAPFNKQIAIKMQSNCTLKWETYNNNVCRGFSDLQQNEEFVDMTLAADGHFVKVHQTLLALASPYFRDILKTVPSKHPVIFLTNVTYTELSYLLEYIYTGEVVVPQMLLDGFVKSAKALHIKGIASLQSEVIAPNKSTLYEGIRTRSYNNRVFKENTGHVIAHRYILDTESEEDQESDQHLDQNVEVNEQYENDELDKELAAIHGVTEDNTNALQAPYNQEQGINGEQSPLELQIHVPPNELLQTNTENILCSNEDTTQFMQEHNTVNAQRVQNPLEIKICVPRNKLLRSNSTQNNVCNNEDTAQIIQEEYNSKNVEKAQSPLEIQIHMPPNEPLRGNSEINVISDQKIVEAMHTESFVPRYTVSNQGTLQLIINRFMYMNWNKKQRGRLRRWRCIDYRKKRCPAFVDMINGVIDHRGMKHNHVFHDEKIMKKLRANLISDNACTEAGLAD